MLNRIILLSAIVALCLTAEIHADEVAVPGSSKVRDLQQQRIEVLEQRVSAIKVFVSGQRGEVLPGLFETQLEAGNELIDAKLEIAETPDQTTALLKSAVENAQHFEHLFKVRGEDPVAVLQAVAGRLEAELRLAKYEQSHGKPAATDRCQQLQQQQITVLAQLGTAIEAFISGQRSDVSPQLFEFAMATKSRHLEAQLSFETAPEKQLTLLSNHLDESKRYENLLRSRGESSVSILSASAMRLNAEIRMAQLEEQISAQK